MNTQAATEVRHHHAGTTAQIYYIGQNSVGQWVARTESGHRGGLFTDRVQAYKFAMLANGRHPEAVIMVPGVLELDLQ
jgi:hypothetical protein